jgi:hypothetical protein
MDDEVKEKKREMNKSREIFGLDGVTVRDAGSASSSPLSGRIALTDQGVLDPIILSWSPSAPSAQVRNLNYLFILYFRSVPLFLSQKKLKTVTIIILQGYAVRVPLEEMYAIRKKSPPVRVKF